MNIKCDFFLFSFLLLLNLSELSSIKGSCKGFVKEVGRKDERMAQIRNIPKNTGTGFMVRNRDSLCQSLRRGKSENTDLLTNRSYRQEGAWGEVGKAVLSGGKKKKKKSYQPANFSSSQNSL